MFLIPYIYSKNEGLYNIHRFYIFLNQGKSFIEEDNINEFCNDNDIFYDKKDIINNICYIRVTKETNIKQFYSYTENSNAECWRNFILFEDDSLHVNSTNPEFIQPILKLIMNL